MNKTLRITMATLLLAAPIATHAEATADRTCSAIFAGEPEAAQVQRITLSHIGVVQLAKSKNWEKPGQAGAAVQFNIETEPVSFTVATTKGIDHIEGGGTVLQVANLRQYKRGYVMPWNTKISIDGPDGKHVVEVECTQAN